MNTVLQDIESLYAAWNSVLPLKYEELDYLDEKYYSRSEENYVDKIHPRSNQKFVEELLRKSKPLQDHPHLEKYNLPSTTTIRQWGNLIVVPLVRLADGTPENVLLIDESGRQQLLLRDYRVGAVHVLGQLESLKYVRQVYLCIGFETGLLLHMQQGVFTIPAILPENLSYAAHCCKMIAPNAELTIFGERNNRTMQDCYNAAALANANLVWLREVPESPVIEPLPYHVSGAGS